MKRSLLASVVFLTSLLVACGGSGGGSPIPQPTSKPTQSPTTYSVKLHWEPDANVGLASALRRPAAIRRMTTIAGETIVVQSPNGGQSPFDGSSPAYVTVSVSPEPSPGTAIDITTTSQVAVVDPTPSPAVPNPSASPAVLLVGDTGASESGQTVTATVGTDSTTDPLLVIKTLALVAPSSGSPVLPDAIGFTFDANCNAVPQGMTTGSDIYLIGPNNATVNFPAGGVAVAHGYDVSTLTTSDWSNSTTSITLDALSNALDDTIIFQTGTGRIVYLSADGYGGNNSAVASFNGGYGCLN